jgi:signal transduction histidine kinase/ActR/RegA family two-component response regulator
MYDWDITTGSVYFTDSLRTVYGHRDFQPHITWWEAQVHPDDLPAAAAALRRAVEGPGETWKCEYRFRRADGSWVRVLDRGCFVRDERGRAVRMVGAMQDVTEQRRVEGQLLQAQKMDVMGQLAAGVAHDFNNVLTAMFGYLEVVEDGARHGQDTPAELAELRRVADQAAALTRQLLLFGRRQSEHPRPIDLVALVDESRTLLQRLLGRAHRLELSVGRGLWAVHMDPTHAEQVLMNLVVNARDAMPAGGAVSIEMENAVLEAPLEGAEPAALPPGQYVRVLVSDGGVGMDPALLARIWEPFFTTKGALRGTGLGLPTVRGLVGRARGGVVVYSTPGKGSTFAVYLPRETTAPARRRTPTSVPDGSERVLLVEDDVAVRDALRRALERHGYAVTAPDDVEDALARLERGDPTDVVVLDAELDAQRMADVGAVLRALSRHPVSTSLVLMAGVGEPRVPDPSGRRCVVVDKPFATDALLRALRSAVDGER